MKTVSHVRLSSILDVDRVRRHYADGHQRQESLAEWNRRRVAQSTQCVVWCGQLLLLAGVFGSGYLMGQGIAVLCFSAAAL